MWRDVKRDPLSCRMYESPVTIVMELPILTYQITTGSEQVDLLQRRSETYISILHD